MNTEATIQVPVFDGGYPTSFHRAFAEATESRVQRIARALEAPGATAMLIGAPGSGKINLARLAAASLEKSLNSAPRCVEFDSEKELELAAAVWNDQRLLADSEQLAPADDPTQTDGQAVEQTSEQTLLIIVRDVDRFSDTSTDLLLRFARSTRVRLLCTASRCIGPADRLLRHPEAGYLGVEPLTLDETSVFLSRLLDIEHLTRDTSHRWHAVTLGNLHALTVLALAAKRSGTLLRSGRIAWIASGYEELPSEFVTELDPLTPAERETVEFVSVAAPMYEPALLRLLDDRTVEALLERHILAVRNYPDGTSALVTRLPITGAAMRAQLSPLRRSQIASACFNALTADVDHFPTLSSSSRIRLVRFGLDGGCSMPNDWLWYAMRATMRSEDMNFALRVALTAMRHENPARRAESILHALDLARFLGDHGARREALLSLHELLQADGHTRELDDQLLIMLEFAAILFEPAYELQPELACSALDNWRLDRVLRGLNVPPIAHSFETRLRAFSGQLDAVIASPAS